MFREIEEGRGLWVEGGKIFRGGSEKEIQEKVEILDKPFSTLSSVSPTGRKSTLPTLPRSKSRVHAS